MAQPISIGQPNQNAQPNPKEENIVHEVLVPLDVYSMRSANLLQEALDSYCKCKNASSYAFATDGDIYADNTVDRDEENEVETTIPHFVYIQSNGGFAVKIPDNHIDVYAVKEAVKRIFEAYAIMLDVTVGLGVSSMRAIQRKADDVRTILKHWNGETLTDDDLRVIGRPLNVFEQSQFEAVYKPYEEEKSTLNREKLMAFIEKAQQFI